MKTIILLHVAAMLNLGVLVSLGQSISSPPTYAVIDLGDLGGGYSLAYGINNNGQVVGYSYINGSVYHAVLYSNGLMQDLGTLDSSGSSVAYGINDKCQIVGQSVIGSYERSFLWQNGVMTDLGTFGGSNYNAANGINENGQVVGYSEVSNDSAEWAFLWQGGPIQGLIMTGGKDSEAYGINNSGQVVGVFITTNNLNPYLAVLWQNGSMRDLGNLEGSNGVNPHIARAINNNGQIVGHSNYKNGSFYHAFLWQNGVMTNLGTLQGAPGNSDAYSINDNGQVVGYSISYGPGGGAFMWQNGTMYSLHSLLLNTNSGWILKEATAINNNGQIVGYGTNPQGQTHAFLLNPLLPGATQAASTVQTSLPAYGTLPTPEAGKGLVFVTHGWIDSQDMPATLPEAFQFVNSTSNLVAKYLANNGLNNWQISGYIWASQADIPFQKGGPTKALSNAEQQGKIIGDEIVQGGWTHVHFIAHSAGAGMIQKATEEIKATSLTPVTIHCTFLDAYDGAVGEKAYEYGSNADWADSYFVRDPIQQFGWTGRLLPNAYNVDVTVLDPNSSSGPWYDSPLDPSSCNILQSNHGWPNGFYANTLSGNVLSAYDGSYYDGFGFPLSEEAGNWTFATNQYPVGNGLTYGSVMNLGPNNGICMPTYISPPLYIGSVPGFSVVNTIQSLTGTVQKFLGSIVPGTGSPVWLATVITDTNALNFVSFNAEFTSASGADGLLTVYWDTNLIGEVDEAAVRPGLQRYIFSFPNAAPNTSHVLGFHVDPFTAVHSSMILTNIVTGCAGVSRPPVLTAMTNGSNGLRVYQLTGQPATYTIQVSTNLASTNWLNIATVANANGVVSFVDPGSTNQPMRFYRAAVPTGLTQ